jgi:hypothetical protein
MSNENKEKLSGVEFYMEKYNTSDRSKWGPHYWYMIHNFSATYPEFPSDIDLEIAKIFLKILPFLLPCGECSKHCFNYIKQLDERKVSIIINSKKEFFKFFYDMHNFVNMRLNKPVYSGRK